MRGKGVRGKQLEEMRMCWESGKHNGNRWSKRRRREQKRKNSIVCKEGERKRSGRERRERKAIGEENVFRIRKTKRK